MFAFRLIKPLSSQLINAGKGTAGLLGRRNIARWVAPALRELKRRRDKLGPAPPTHRSTELNWNLNAELYAFGKRLNEDFRSDSLLHALTHPSYIEREEKRRKDVGITDVALSLTDNSKLIAKGEALMKKYIPAYLRFTHPFLPEEGINCIYEFLVSEQILSHVCFNIGTSDLILCEELKPTELTLAKTMKAIVGAIVQDSGAPQAEIFVQDFVLTQLIGRDVNDLWPIANPMGLLIEILRREGRELPESRLIRQSGMTTIQAVFNVGIYSAKKLIGTGPGETVAIAEEMAARDSLKRLFQTVLHKPPLPFGRIGHSLNVHKGGPNPSISDWTTQLASEKAGRLTTN